MMAAFSANAFSTTSFRAARTFNQRGTETAACLSATSVKDDNINVLISRRKAIAEQTAFVFTAFASVYSGYLPDATALDMDAFINSEVRSSGLPVNKGMLARAFPTVCVFLVRTRKLTFVNYLTFSRLFYRFQLTKTA